MCVTCKSSRCKVQEHSCSFTACRGCSIFTKAATKSGGLIASFVPASCCPEWKSGLEAQAVFYTHAFLHNLLREYVDENGLLIGAKI